MNKYFGWMFAFVTTLSLTSVFAQDNDEATDSCESDQVEVVINMEEILDDVDTDSNIEE